MANEKRVIDAIGLDVKLAKRIGPMIISDRPAADIYKVMLSCIADAPTVDAVEVVRCKKCKWSRTDENDNADVYYCELRTGRAYHSGDFCSYGERRAEK